MMIKGGFAVREALSTWVKMDKWQSVLRKEVRFVMNLKWFRKQGLMFLHDFTKVALKAKNVHYVLADLKRESFISDPTSLSLLDFPEN